MTNTSISSIEQEIARQNLNIKKLEKQLREFKDLSPNKKLAISLHELSCHWNHTDGCGWYYEFKDGQHDWQGSSHGSYLSKAEKLIGKCTECNIAPDTAMQIISMAKGI